MILLEGLYKSDLEKIEENLINEYSYISCGVLGNCLERDKKEDEENVTLRNLEERLSIVEHTVFFLETDIVNELTIKLKEYLLHSKLNVKIIKVKDYTLNEIVKEIKEECQFMR